MTMIERSTLATAATELSTPVERMYFAWNDALSRNDAAALLALYAKDAHFESPLVPHLLGTTSGVLNGHEELRPPVRPARAAKAARSAILPHRLPDRRQTPDLGISARRGQRRADGFRRGDGTQRRRPHPTTLCLLGLVRLPGLAAERISPVKAARWRSGVRVARPSA